MPTMLALSQMAHHSVTPTSAVELDPPTFAGLSGGDCIQRENEPPKDSVSASQDEASDGRPLTAAPPFQQPLGEVAAGPRLGIASSIVPAGCLPTLPVPVAVVHPVGSGLLNALGVENTIIGDAVRPRFADATAKARSPTGAFWPALIPGGIHCSNSKEVLT